MLAVTILAILVGAIWPSCALMLHIHRHIGLGAGPHVYLFHELRPLYLPAMAILILTSDHAWRWKALLAAITLVIWYSLKDSGGDDDRWLRRRRKVTERLSRAAGAS